MRSMLRGRYSDETGSWKLTLRLIANVRKISRRSQS